ncbi:MAG: hypothetical protein Q9169_006019 [Polycauliona sp. 2 TL-2023]
MAPIKQARRVGTKGVKLKCPGPKPPSIKDPKIKDPKIKDPTIQEPKVKEPNSLATKPPKIEKPESKLVKVEESDGPKPKSKSKAPAAAKMAVPTKEIGSVKKADDFASLLSGPIITFYLGPNRQPFHIHRNLICSASSYFRTLFPVPPSSSPSDSSSPILQLYLLNHDPTSFELLQSFLYRGSATEFAPPPPTPQKGEKEQQDNLTATLVTHATNIEKLITVYLLLSHDWSLPSIKNISIDHLRRYMSPLQIILSTAQIDMIYERTSGEGEGKEDDQLRRYVVDQFIFRTTRKGMKKAERGMHLGKRMGVAGGGFVAEVFEKLVEGKKYVDPDLKGRCAYHKHEKGEGCAG